MKIIMVVLFLFTSIIGLAKDKNIVTNEMYSLYNLFNKNILVDAEDTYEEVEAKCKNMFPKLYKFKAVIMDSKNIHFNDREKGDKKSKLKKARKDLGLNLEKLNQRMASIKNHKKAKDYFLCADRMGRLIGNLYRYEKGAKRIKNTNLKDLFPKGRGGIGY